MTCQNKIKRYYPGLLLLCLWVIPSLSCQKEEITETFIDEQLQQYFDRFATEAAARGNTVDFGLVRVEGFLSNTLAPSISGQCQHDPNHPDRVLINRTFWNTASATEKEFLVFHELGHCYLQRPHLDTKDSQGNCISIMHSGATVCRNNYSSLTRESYLNELFNPNEDE